MRFLLYIFLFLGLIPNLWAQDSTGFWKHLSVEGNVGAFYLKRNDEYLKKRYPGPDKDSYSISTNVRFKEGFSGKIGMSYSLRHNEQIKNDRNMGFFMLGLNCSFSSFTYQSNINNLHTSSHTWSSDWIYTPDIITGTTQTIELGVNSKYLFRAGRVFFGVNASINRGTFLNVEQSELDVLYTHYAINSMAPPTYDTSRYKINVNNYFGKKSYNSITAGLILGIRLKNVLLFANEEYYYTDEYRYFKINLGLNYFF